MRYETEIVVHAGPKEVFDFVDDHKRLAFHMSQSSWMMGGGSMNLSLDEGRGQRVGSHIRMSGKAFGINLNLDEVVTHYEPPNMKIWETVGEPKLLVIGHYSMGIEITPKGTVSILRVYIDYDLPKNHRWLGRIFSGVYAKWWVAQMITGVRDNFRASKRTAI